MSAYSVFSRYYDILTRNVEYAVRAQYFHTLIQQNMQGAALLLDLACGTGSLSTEFAALGYDVIGADGSQDMLSVALQKNSGILYLCQNMDKLDLYGTVDATVCALDSLNHLRDEAALAKTFARVALFTNPGGLFLFDVNTPYKHREVLGNNAFVYDCDDVYCVWQNAYTAQHDRVDITLDFFQQTKKNQYVRQREQFSERIFSDELIRRLFVQSGFSLLHTYGDDSFDEPQKDTQRLVYIAKKE